MRRMFLMILYFLTSVFALSCKNKSNTEKKEYIPFEVINSYITHDTLKVVSTSDYLFYPFDKTVDVARINTGIEFEMDSLGSGIYLLNYKSSFF